MNFATCAWELKKTLSEKEISSSYQFQSSKIKIGGLESKNSKIRIPIADKAVVIIEYFNNSKSVILFIYFQLLLKTLPNYFHKRTHIKNKK